MGTYLGDCVSALVSDFSLANLGKIADALDEIGYEQVATTYRLLARRFRADPSLLDPWTCLLFKEQARLICFVAELECEEIEGTYHQQVTNDRYLRVQVSKAGKRLHINLQLEPIHPPAQTTAPMSAVRTPLNCPALPCPATGFDRYESPCLWCQPATHSSD